MIFVGLGSNRPGIAGSPQAMLQAALACLPRHGISVRRRSSVYRTESEPNPADPEFLNMVIEVETCLGPAQLLDRLHRVERALGRRRKYRNEPRSIDLDLLSYRRIRTVSSAGGWGPDVPHPRLQERGFVLAPLVEICPAWRHPVTKCSGAALLAALPRKKRPQKLG